MSDNQSGRVEVPGPWDGWCRKPRGRWRRVVHCALTQEEAIARLRELTRDELSVDLCALRVGVHPLDPIGQGGTTGKRA